MVFTLLQDIAYWKYEDESTLKIVMNLKVKHVVSCHMTLSCHMTMSCHMTISGHNQQHQDQRFYKKKFMLNSVVGILTFVSRINDWL